MIISPKHWEYLYIQRGEVSNAYSKGFDEWKRAYEESIANVMQSIAPALPKQVDQILDVGGGMGGIGIPLTQRYKGAGYRVLDGIDDKPMVVKHATTFNNAAVAADFLAANGVKDFGHYSPTCPLDRKFDLVVSFAAWGFHFEPGEYLERVVAAMAPHATVILDVRKDRTGWAIAFLKAFGRPSHVLERGKKHMRLAWQT